jgi:hypothetical protein
MMRRTKTAALGRAGHRRADAGEPVVLDQEARDLTVDDGMFRAARGRASVSMGSWV